MAKKVKICLDAGHFGKYNRSPVLSSYYESDMNWKLHLLLKAALERYGIEVITTINSVYSFIKDRCSIHVIIKYI